ncbi:MAG: DnaA regulatory inactivator Hda [Gammaproteobacteria bacterium RIFCSPHIGHO2_12_FULL_41_20]|nr:MAG: DnaA regulatory inactivator Hda [Gammaproteobacteria bacterium RIFCSPHIGHO2_12_FULL_41_20]
MLSQLTLGVSIKEEATFANFYPGKNVELITALKNTASGQGERVIYMYSAGGQGRTHLLQACCHYAYQYGLRSVYLSLAGHYSPEILQGLECLSLVCIDDVNRVAGSTEWEEALFHAYNRILNQGGCLIVTANSVPKLLKLTLPDLVSRLAGGVIYAVQPLSDNEKLQTLVMRAGQRGMTLSEEVGKFLLTHCPRHMTTLFAALDALDKASLAAQRRLTIPFVKTVLQI